MTKIKNIFKLLIAFLIFTISIFQLKNEIQSIDFKKVLQVISGRPIIYTIGLILIGILGIFILCFYDYILLSIFKSKKISKLKMFKVSWIANSFNALLGFGGIIGSSIRYSLYKPIIKEYEVNKLNKAVSLLMISTISGVGFLSLLVVSNIFSYSILINEKPFLKVVLWFCSILLPIYIAIITIKPPLKEKRWLGLQFTIVSIVDYLTSGVVMYAAMRFLGIDINFIEMESIFIIATIAGIVSMIPGGLGSFDLLFLLGTTKELNIESDLVLISLFLYRLSYYILPFLIGILLSINELQQKARSIVNNLQFVIFTRELGTVAYSISKKQISYIGRTIISISFIIISIYFIEISFLTFINYDYIQNTLQLAILPLYFSTSLIMVINVVGILGGAKESLYHLKIIASLLTVCVTYTFFVYGSVVLLSFILLLFLWTIYFLLKNWIDVYCVKSSFIEKFLGSLVLIYAIRELLIIHFLFEEIQLRKNIMISIILVLLFSILLILSRVKIRSNLWLDFLDKSMVQSILNLYGGNNLSHLIYLKDNKLYWDKENDLGVIFQETAHNIFILGDPIGDYKNIFKFLNKLLLKANHNGKHLIFYQVSKEHLNHYNDLNFNIFKIGEEGIVDLDEFSLSGKKKRGLRATNNQLDKLNYTFEIIDFTNVDNIFDELKKISDNWIGERKEMTFSIGEFEKSYLEKAPIGVLKHDLENKIIGFVSIMPSYTTKSISIDLIRWDTELDIAMMDALYLKTMLWAKNKGYSKFNIGMAPFSDSNNNNSTLKHAIIESIYSNSQYLYSFKGLRQYKEKFKPSWNSKYVIYNKISLFQSLYCCYRLINKK